MRNSCHVASALSLRTPANLGDPCDSLDVGTPQSEAPGLPQCLQLLAAQIKESLHLLAATKTSNAKQKNGVLTESCHTAQKNGVLTAQKNVVFTAGHPVLSMPSMFPVGDVEILPQRCRYVSYAKHVSR